MSVGPLVSHVGSPPCYTLTTRSEMFPDGVAYVTVGQAPDLATWNGTFHEGR